MLLDTPICDFGWKAREFTLKDPDGFSFTMSEQMGKKGLLIAFICNHCPYVQRIADRLADDTAELLDYGINTLAIMSNDYTDYPEDSPQNMKLFAEKHNFKFPYLIDETQEVGKKYGAICTPDFFGFNSEGELQYRGRLDDAMAGSGSTPKRELVEAMKLVAQSGEGPANQFPSMGCSIKWR